MTDTSLNAGERVAEAPRAEPDLARTLSALSLICIGIGSTVGAGIFVLTGTAAAHYAGPGLMLSFVLGGIASGLVGLCYAELAATMPVAGSSYSYARATFGALPAWIVGWDLVLEFALAAATIAVGWSGYAQSLMADAGGSFRRRSRPRRGRAGSSTCRPPGSCWRSPSC